jgi:aminomethyltransferase
MVEFGGWNMPLAYGEGTLAEHRACRSSAAMFDVSHLGTVRVVGDGAFSILQEQLGNDLRRVAPGRAQYTHLLDEGDASVVDDLIVWWVDDDRFDVMPNASNTADVLDALGGDDVTATRTVLAVQGPHARRVLAGVSPEAAAVDRFDVRRLRWRGADVVVAGTGYTGEDGVECALEPGPAVELWRSLVDGGVTPAGLGARDTLRLEAGLPLYGHELGPAVTPLQAGLGWAVGWDKEHFRGRGPLVAERAHGPRRRLWGLVAEGRQPPRQGAPITAGDRTVGTVTSGNFSPVLGRGIAMGFVDTSASLAEGDEVEATVRGRPVRSALARLPFLPRDRARP